MITLGTCTYSGCENAAHYIDEDGRLCCGACPIKAHKDSIRISDAPRSPMIKRADLPPPAVEGMLVSVPSSNGEFDTSCDNRFYIAENGDLMADMSEDGGLPRLVEKSYRGPPAWRCHCGKQATVREVGGLRCAEHATPIRVMPRAALLIHRVGPVGPQRDRNIAATLKWIRFLVAALPDVAISVPWLPYVLALDETTHRERGMRDGALLAAAAENEIGIICGPEVSTGCAGDRDGFIGLGRGVLDLTCLGLVDPPASIPEVLAFVYDAVSATYRHPGREVRVRYTAGQPAPTWYLYSTPTGG